MTRTLTLSLIAVAAMLAPAAGASATQPVTGTPPRLGDTELQIASVGPPRTFVPTELCGQPSQPATLPCGSGVRIPPQRALAFPAGARLSYSFGAPVTAAFATFYKVERRRLVSLTGPIRLSTANTAAAVRTPRLAVRRGDEVVLSVLAIYARPVQTGTGHEGTVSVSDPSAVFDVPLRVGRVRRCPHRKCAATTPLPHGPMRTR